MGVEKRNRRRELKERVRRFILCCLRMNNVLEISFPAFSLTSAIIAVHMCVHT